MKPIDVVRYADKKNRMHVRSVVKPNKLSDIPFVDLFDGIHLLRRWSSHARAHRHTYVRSKYKCEMTQSGWQRYRACSVENVLPPHFVIAVKMQHLYFMCEYSLVFSQYCVFTGNVIGLWMALRTHQGFATIYFILCHSIHVRILVLHDTFRTCWCLSLRQLSYLCNI
jgi:hypothetical protein